MKLTKQKLEQLIMEEFKTMSQKIFDKRRKQHGDELFRVFGDEDQPIEYPELHDKLGTLYSGDPESRKQALDLADTLDEPIDRKFSGMKTIPLAPEKRYNPRTNINTYGTKPEHWEYGTWYHYVRKGFTKYFEDEIDEDTFERYIEWGEDRDEFPQSRATPEEKQNLRKKLETERNDINSKYYIDRRRFNWQRRQELEDLYGWDLVGRTWR
tara:strand:+ start:526 stop:1158 length:633 start_codon:yes stop_codon:yes gene_type:complete